MEVIFSVESTFGRTVTFRFTEFCITKLRSYDYQQWNAYTSRGSSSERELTGHKSETKLKTCERKRNEGNVAQTVRQA
jgi:hypothetical protein